MRPTLLALALVAAPAAAQEGPQPVLAKGETLEVQTRADLNADGLSDLAYIVRGQDSRELRVVTSYRDQFDIGENIPQVLALDPYPLVDATLSVSKNVLLLDDLTGGTTAEATRHRFRWDAKLAAMRLIGLDATLYSRTFAHDGIEVSWNLLTGVLVTRELKRNAASGDAAYVKTREKRVKKPSRPLKLEQSPSGGDLLGWPGGQ